jgi:hypothetical protein
VNNQGHPIPIAIYNLSKKSLLGDVLENDAHRLITLEGGVLESSMKCL